MTISEMVNGRPIGIPFVAIQDCSAATLFVLPLGNGFFTACWEIDDYWWEPRHVSTSFEYTIIDEFHDDTDAMPTNGGPCRCDLVELLKQGCVCGSIKRWEAA